MITNNSLLKMDLNIYNTINKFNLKLNSLISKERKITQIKTIINYLEADPTLFKFFSNENLKIFQCLYFNKCSLCFNDLLTIFVFSNTFLTTDKRFYTFLNLNIFEPEILNENLFLFILKIFYQQFQREKLYIINRDKIVLNLLTDKKILKLSNSKSVSFLIKLYRHNLQQYILSYQNTLDKFISDKNYSLLYLELYLPKKEFLKILKMNSSDSFLKFFENSLIFYILKYNFKKILIREIYLSLYIE